MKVYTLIREQKINKSVKEAWEFLSDPSNLARITPEHMDFSIQSITEEGKTYAGQIIKYKVGILPLIRVGWVTEITHVKEPAYFVDEQRVGPYKLWHHQHILVEKDDGVYMKDIVNYALPLGILGRIAHVLYVKNKLKSIFEFRSEIIKNYL